MRLELGTVCFLTAIRTYPDLDGRLVTVCGFCPDDPEGCDYIVDGEWCGARFGDQELRTQRSNLIPLSGPTCDNAQNRRTKQPVMAKR